VSEINETIAAKLRELAERTPRRDALRELSATISRKPISDVQTLMGEADYVRTIAGENLEPRQFGMLDHG